MTQKIHRLPEAVINQIAAGEVVENPASIVKELIENSLDAGASHIDVQIVEGGQQLIRVEDDGSGMDPEDAVLCLERHATSKIGQIEDLQTLLTMGFRGEALAAIASVSQFELKTCREGVATRVVVEGGRITVVEPCARNRGTTIEVRSLFYNTPARKKFQKSASANASQVARVIETIALAHPEIAFSLSAGGKKSFDLPAQNRKERIEEILGGHEHEIVFEQKGILISGYLASPQRAMINRSGQHLYINRRPIFSPLISRAVKDGFGTRIGEHAYPPYVLYLEIPPDLVDINVHPQKKEARFRDDGGIYRLFQDAVSSAFSSAPTSFLEPISFTPPPLFSFAEEPKSNFVTREEPELKFTFTERPLAVMNGYLLLQKDHWLLVDLRAALSRILYESMSVEKGGAQALIWPLEIELLPGEEKMGEELAQIGIECRLLGKKTLAIDTLPPFLEAAHFPEFLAKWKEGKKLGDATSRFCRSLKKTFLLDEAELIWRRLQKCTDRYYDPTGKPIWVEVKEADLERVLRNAH